MSEPDITFSCICLTYARTHRLSYAIWCYLNQQCDAASELIVLNTCPQQTVSFDQDSRVKVINLPERPATLGECRNIAIQHAKGKWLVTWDDDDVYMPWHLQHYRDAMTDSDDFLWLSRQLSWNDKCLTMVKHHGAYNVLSFTMDAWAKVGGYRQINFGEDGDLAQRLKQHLSGRTVDIPDDRISFCHFSSMPNAANWRITQHGQDEPGKITGYERIGQRVSDLFKRNKLQQGQIGIRAVQPPEFDQLKRFATSAGCGSTKQHDKNERYKVFA